MRPISPEGLEQSSIAFGCLKTHVAYENILYCCSYAGGSPVSFREKHEAFPNAKDDAICAAPWLRSGGGMDELLFPDGFTNQHHPN
jgi:hypothetical protein